MSERKEKFTPGPWRVHLDKRNGTVCAIIEDKSGDCVAKTFPRYPRGERNANGYLIAVAPEMFTALMEVLNWYNAFTPQATGRMFVPDDMIENVLKALKKARGEE